LSSFEWGDFGSTCCKTADVTRPGPRVFSVTFNPCSYVYGEEIDFAFGESYWRTHRIRARDRTGEVELSHPNCEGNEPDTPRPVALAADLTPALLLPQHPDQHHPEDLFLLTVDQELGED
jgi:hypothetical protein